MTHPTSVAACRAAHEIVEHSPAGVIRLIVKGFFDLATLDDHFAQKADVVRRWRAVGLPVRILIDARELSPHSPEGQARVQRACDEIYRSDDRVAILVESVLTKRQMRRSIPLEGVIDFYVSEDAALRWLTA